MSSGNEQAERERKSPLRERLFRRRHTLATQLLELQLLIVVAVLVCVTALSLAQSSASFQREEGRRALSQRNHSRPIQRYVNYSPRRRLVSAPDYKVRSTRCAPSRASPTSRLPTPTAVSSFRRVPAMSASTHVRHRIGHGRVWSTRPQARQWKRTFRFSAVKEGSPEPRSSASSTPRSGRDCCSLHQTSWYTSRWPRFSGASVRSCWPAGQTADPRHGGPRDPGPGSPT